MSWCSLTYSRRRHVSDGKLPYPLCERRARPSKEEVLTSRPCPAYISSPATTTGPKPRKGGARRSSGDAKGTSIVLLSSQPKYHDIKRVYPHYLHGKTRDGAIHVGARRALATSALSGRGLLMRRLFHSCTSTWLESTTGKKRMVTVLDIEGLRFSEVNKFLLNLISTASMC